MIWRRLTGAQRKARDELSVDLGASSMTREDWIVIFVPTHRSGSTFLQRVINASPEMHMWGETSIGPQLLRMHEALRRGGERGGHEQRCRFMAGERGIWQAHMVPSTETVKRSLRITLDTMLQVPGRRPGMKEINYNLPTIELLRELLPQGRFLMLVRHPFDSWKSLKNRGWWPHSLEHWARGWADRALAYQEYCRKHPENTRFLRLEHIDAAAIEDIYEFVGLEYGPHVAAVAEQEVGGSTMREGLEEQEKDTISAICGDAYQSVYGRGIRE